MNNNGLQAMDEKPEASMKVMEERELVEHARKVDMVIDYISKLY